VTFEAEMILMQQTRLKFVFALLISLVVMRAQAAEPTTIFDGKSLDGWKQAGPGKFELHDGMITATGGMGLLWYDREYSNFVCRVEFKTAKDEDNSGVFVRFPDPGNDPWVAVNHGHEIQICNTEKGNQTGAIYNFQNSTSEPTKPLGEWNTMEIRVVDQNYKVTLNGQLINDYTSTTRPLRGYIGLQNHWGAVSFRKVTVEELPGGAPMMAGDPVALDSSSPGWVGQYFNEIRSYRQLSRVKSEPFYVRTDPQINFEAVSGDFYGSHLAEDFGVIWHGAIHIDTPGNYVFNLRSDDGSKLTIDGKVVIDNVATHPMTAKAGEINFAKAGDYPVKLEYYQLGGEAGCILNWKPPGTDKLVSIPPAALVHAKSDEAVKWNKEDWNLYTFDHHAYIQKHGKPYEKMDYGPFLSGTFKAPLPENNTTLKGVIVSLDKDHTTNIIFDTEMCRYSAGWTGDFIDFHGVAYDGAHGVTPTIKGTQIFGTPVMPGWEHNGSFKDPRPTPYGNLPADWIKYRGLYRCGDQVVFSYTVNGVGVLDTPGAAIIQGRAKYFTRTLQVDPSKAPLTLVVFEGDGNAPVYKGSPNLKVWIDEKGRGYATIPPHDNVEQYSLVLGTQVIDANNFEYHPVAINFEKLLKGGPGNWGEPIVTQGKLGKDAGPYTVDTITLPTKTPYDAWMRTSGFDFFPDGHSAAICTWNGDVWIVKGIDEKMDHLTWQRYATGLFQTLGLKIVNGEVYVLGRDQITRLHDLNGDGEADWYENFNNDCQVSDGFHEFAHDLQVDSHGNFFYAKGGPVNPGGEGFQKLTANAGCIMEVSADGKKSQVYATGLRAPNGMSIGPDDQMTVSDNQGTWTPACRISFVTKGAFLGVPTTSHLNPPPTNYGNPICWFPYAGNGNAVIDNSSGGAAWDLSSKWGPMEGKIIHLSYSSCSIFELMTENIDGIWQGGAVMFPLDFDSGIMRARFNPVDGQLYVTGLKGWQTRAAEDGCFQRVRYTGKTVHMPSELHVQKDGIAISFNEPVDPSTATDPDNYNIEQWNYIWSGSYGSPDVSRDDPKKKGHDTVDIDSIKVSPDGKSIFIKINDLKPVMQMKTIMKIKAADGTPMNWEVDQTINIVPGQKPIATSQPTEH
jgi:hypothetical protein